MRGYNFKTDDWEDGCEKLIVMNSTDWQGWVQCAECKAVEWLMASVCFACGSSNISEKIFGRVLKMRKPGFWGWFDFHVKSRSHLIFQKRAKS